MPQKPQYYTIVFEKFIDLITESERYYFMLAQQLKEYVAEVKMEDWDESPIPDFMETMVILQALRQFLDNKINKPSEEEVKFATANNIKDVLVTAEELSLLQSMVITLEDQKELLKSQYNFDYAVN
jgi:hypothetical protein